MINNKLINFLMIASISWGSINSAYAWCDGTDSIIDYTCQSVINPWKNGENELYIPFYSYHLRSAYTAEKISTFRENTWGLGYGRNAYNSFGNLDTLFVMDFLDSHSKPEYMVGYAHQWMWGARDGLHAGLGYTAFLTARSDVIHYIPFPAVLPIASINYNKVALNATFVPGGKGNGNVAFFWTTLGF